MNKSKEKIDNFCSKIPVQYLDYIQSFGVLLVLSKQDLTIVQVSENVNCICEKSAEQLLNLKLSDFSPHHFFHQIALLIEKNQKGKIVKDEVFQVDNQEIIIHEYTDYYIIECLIISNNHVAFEPHIFFPTLKQIIKEPSNPQSLPHAIQELIEKAKAILGFDKILVYQFLEDGHGVVIAEAKEPDMESYLGLHFPSNDAPPQVKAMYLRNPLRIVYDCLKPSVSLVPSINPLTQNLLDLSRCLLKGVSPIHQEYVQNMHIRTSISYAILNKDQLWGIISFHHRTPKMVFHSNRLAIITLGSLINNFCSQSETSQQSQLNKDQLNIFSSLIDSMAKSEKNMDKVIVDYEHDLLKIFNAEGGAIYYQGKLSLMKNTPTSQEVEKLIHWLNTYQTNEVFCTDELPLIFSKADAYKKLACGLLSIRMKQDTSNYFLFFRSEQALTVKWGGNPYEDINISPDLQLSPRKSFQIWQEQVAGRSKPWLSIEVNAAEILKSEFITALLYLQSVRKIKAEAEAFILKIAADQASEGVFIVNSDGKIQWLNKWLIDLLDPSTIEIAKGSFIDVLTIEFNLSVNKVKELKEAFQSSQSTKLEISFEKLGSKRFLFLIINPFEYEGKKFVGILSDITTVKAMALVLQEQTQELEKTNMRLKELNQQKDNFMRMAAHDLRNPLATILTATTILEANKQPTEVSQKLLSLINKQSHFMLELLNETLSTNINTASQLDLNKEEVNLKEFIQQIYKFNQMLTSEKNIDLILDLKIEKPICLIDKVKIKQVIDNLLSNAIKYSNPHTTIHFRVTETAKQLRVEVEDQGLGIPLEEQPHIFIKPIKSSNQPTHGETSYSLGLLICKQIITAYGGKIGFTSAPGKGSTFYFEIPI